MIYYTISCRIVLSCDFALCYNILQYTIIYCSVLYADSNSGTYGTYIVDVRIMLTVEVLSTVALGFGGNLTGMNKY